MMESSKRPIRRAHCRGATLIEALVALAILSFGLAGIAATQFRSLAYLRETSHESRALFHAADMAERLQGRGGGPDAAELARWQAEFADALPAGKAEVCIDSTPGDGAASAPACDGAGDFLAIKLWWDEDQDGEPERRQVTVLRPWKPAP